MKHANAFVKLVEDALKHVPEVTPDEVMSWVKPSPPAGEGRVGGLSPNTAPPPSSSLPQGEGGFILIDVREDREWQAGHVAGAIHIGKGVIERDIEARVPDHGTKIVLYCGGGYRSALAGESIKKMGYDNVYSMSGGWREWCEKGYPVEK